MWRVQRVRNNDNNKSKKNWRRRRRLSRAWFWHLKPLSLRCYNKTMQAHIEALSSILKESVGVEPNNNINILRIRSRREERSECIVDFRLNLFTSFFFFLFVDFSRYALARLLVYLFLTFSQESFVSPNNSNTKWNTAKSLSFFISVVVSTKHTQCTIFFPRTLSSWVYSAVDDES